MREKYESLSLAVLKELAKARGLKGISTLRKGQLIEVMLEQDEKDKAAAEQKAAMEQDPFSYGQDEVPQNSEEPVKRRGRKKKEADTGMAAPAMDMYVNRYNQEEAGKKESEGRVRTDAADYNATVTANAFTASVADAATAKSDSGVTGDLAGNGQKMSEQVTDREGQDVRVSGQTADNMNGDADTAEAKIAGTADTTANTAGSTITGRADTTADTAGQVNTRTAGVTTDANSTAGENTGNSQEMGRTEPRYYRNTRSSNYYDDQGRNTQRRRRMPDGSARSSYDYSSQDRRTYDRTRNQNQTSDYRRNYQNNGTDNRRSYGSQNGSSDYRRNYSNQNYGNQYGGTDSRRSYNNSYNGTDNRRSYGDSYSGTDNRRSYGDQGYNNSNQGQESRNGQTDSSESVLNGRYDSGSNEAVQSERTYVGQNDMADDRSFYSEQTRTGENRQNYSDPDGMTGSRLNDDVQNGLNDERQPYDGLEESSDNRNPYGDSGMDLAVSENYVEQNSISEGRKSYSNQNDISSSDNGAASQPSAADLDRPPAELSQLDSGQSVSGILEVMPDGYGFIRSDNYLPGENDVYVSPSQIRRFNLKTGDIISGNTRIKSQQEKFSALLYLKKINDLVPSEAMKRYNFEDMTPIFPNERLRMERDPRATAMRIVDLFSPIGKGQRGMIVSPPKAGKTTLLKDIARSLLTNSPDMKILILLIDERPEEVTDIKEAIRGENVEVIYSTFDETPEHHKRVSEMVIERAKRLVELKQDVTILLDSITRLARAYNLTVPPSGRTLSGGLDPAALHMPKRFFGAARNMREGGSLTILATALVDTGSKMDDVVYEEFKGTGNMELVLDRKLSEKRVFPAIDIPKSGTRREDLLLDREEQEAIYIMRRALNGMKSDEAVENILNMFVHTRDNRELVQRVRRQKFI